MATSITSEDRLHRARHALSAARAELARELRLFAAEDDTDYVELRARIERLEDHTGIGRPR